MFGESWTDCSNEPMPVLEIHGTNDNVTLWDGDYNDTYWGPYPGIEEVINFWVQNNDCEMKLKLNDASATTLATFDKL